MISFSPGCFWATSRDLGQEAAGEQRQGQPGALGRRPQPVDRAVGRPGLLMRLHEDEAQAEHPRPLLPAVDQRAALGRRAGSCRGSPGGRDAGAPPRPPARWSSDPRRRRMDHRRVDAGFVHLLQQIVLGEGGDLTVIRVRGLAVAPDVDLRVDDQHGVLLSVFRCRRRRLTRARLWIRPQWWALGCLVDGGRSCPTPCHH